MIGRLLRVRLKAAETALAENRIDEAFRLATLPDLYAERRAQAVLRRVGEKLFLRAEAHFKAGGYAEALQDLERAERAGAGAERVADLRTIVRAAQEEQSRNQQSRHNRMAQARDRLARGSLRAAEEILQRASGNDLDAQKMMNLAEQRRQRAGQLLKEVRQYFDQGHLSSAATRFLEARRLHPKDPEVVAWEKKLLDRVLESVQHVLVEGKVNRALDEMDLLTGIGDDRPAKREQLRILQQLSLAARAIEQAQYDQARKVVLTLQNLLPEAKWIRKITTQLKQLDDLATELSAGPLGRVAPEKASPRKPDPAAPRPANALGETLLAPSAGGSAGPGLPDRLLVLIDGAGSFLLIRSCRTSIGRSASRRPADIPIISDISERHAEIVRIEDDYFLYAQKEVNVGGEIVRQKLLQNGDRIILGKRAKLTFNLPSRKSASAVLDLSDTVKMPHDVRRIILFDRVATLSRNTDAHIVVPTAGEDLMLLEREGQLWLRHRENGRGDTGVPLNLDTAIEMAGVTLVVEEWQPRT